MTKTFAQAAAAVLSAVFSVAIFAGANGLAAQQFAKAEQVASAGAQVVAMQTVVVVGHRA